MATSSVMVNTFGPAIVNTANFAAVSSLTTITLTASGASNLAITNTLGTGVTVAGTLKVLLPLAEAGIEGKIYTISNNSTTASNTLTIKDSTDTTTYATLAIAQAKATQASVTDANTVTVACYYTGSAYDWIVTSMGFRPTLP